MTNQSHDPNTFFYNPHQHSGFSHSLVEEAYQSLLMSVHHLNEQEKVEVIDACHYGDVAHILDKRKSGEPYITHPIAVAEIIAGFRLDRDTIIAGLLHDTVEDTDVTFDDLKHRYGEKVAQLVDGVTKLKSSQHNKEQNKAATFHKILLSTLDDPRVLIIKLSDRLHNMSTLGAVRPEKQKSTAKETLDFYIPFAHIMGLNNIADHIEILCYRNLDPEMYTKMSDKLLQHGLARRLRKDTIHDYLQRLVNIKKLTGHVKVLENKVVMYRQFFRNRGKIEQLIRQYSLEIILEDIPACKTISTFLIDKYEIPASQISDNIRNPLPGGNQSLTLIYKYQHDTIEINILTKQMKKNSLLGVIGSDNASDVSQSVIQASLRNMKGVLLYGQGNADFEKKDTINKESHNQYNDSHDDKNSFDGAESAIEDLLDYLHARKILCYSPQGKAYELPRGATALDFAYAVGPFIGHRAISAEIEGSEVNLATVVNNGQQINIIIDRKSTPKAEWLGFVGTSKARELISKWLQNLPQKEKQQQGKQALKRALKTYDKKLKHLTDKDWQDLLEWRQLNTKKELFEQIASANLLPQLVVARFFSDEVTDKIHNPSNINQPKNLLAKLPGVEISFPKCCHPLYGDRITGYNSTTHGLVVHRHKCYQLEEVRKHSPQRVFHIQWRDDESLNHHQSGEHAHFTAYLEIESILTDEQVGQSVNLLKSHNIGFEKVEEIKNTSVFHVVVRSRNHLQEGIDALRNILGFANIQRLYQLKN